MNLTKWTVVKPSNVTGYLAGYNDALDNKKFILDVHKINTDLEG